MIARELFEWDAVVLDENENPKSVRVKTYWSPGYGDDMASEIAFTAAAELRGTQKRPFQPVSATLVTS